MCRFGPPTAPDPVPAPCAAAAAAPAARDGLHSLLQGQLRNLAANRTRHGLPLRQTGGQGLHPAASRWSTSRQARHRKEPGDRTPHWRTSQSWRRHLHRPPVGAKDGNNGYTAPGARPTRPFLGSTGSYTASYVYHITRCISWRSLKKVVQVVHLPVQASFKRHRRALTPPTIVGLLRSPCSRSASPSRFWVARVNVTMPRSSSIRPSIWPISLIVRGVAEI